MQAENLCRYCACQLSRSESGTFQDAEGASYCSNAPILEPSHAPESKSDTLRRLARDKRAEAEERKSARDPQRFSIAERDVRELIDEAEALEAEAAHEEARAEEPRIDEARKCEGDTWEVERSDAAGYTELSYSALRSRPSRETLASSESLGRLFVFVPRDASGSDYGGAGSVGKANCASILETCEESGLVEGTDYWKLSGAHSSYGVALRCDARSRALVELLQGLADYPVADEGKLSEVEAEEEAEAWEGLYRSDFQRELESAHGLDLSEVEEETLFELFRSACERTNTYWEHNSEGASIDCERVSQGVTKAEALALPGAARDSADLEAEAEAQAQLAALREPLAQAEAELSKPETERSVDTLSDALEAARVALGSPASIAVRDCAGILAQVANFPIASAPLPESATPAELRAQLSELRRYVGETMRAARESLEALDPQRFKRAQEYGFCALPTETPER